MTLNMTNWLRLRIVSAIALGSMCIAFDTYAQYYAEPAWNQVLPSNTRFIEAFHGGGVLDRETGLVWQRFPGAISCGPRFDDPCVNQPVSWSLAQELCYSVETGSPSFGVRLGWRLPRVEELATLLDPTRSNPALPAGSPWADPDFPDVQSTDYWTATPGSSDPNQAWTINFAGGGVPGGLRFALVVSRFKTERHPFWCVRGGKGSIQ